MSNNHDMYDTRTTRGESLYAGTPVGKDYSHDVFPNQLIRFTKYVSKNYDDKVDVHFDDSLLVTLDEYQATELVQWLSGWLQEKEEEKSHRQYTRNQDLWIV